MKWVPGLVRNPLRVCSVVQQELDAVKFARPRRAMEGRPAFISGDLNMRSATDQEFYHGGVAKHASYVKSGPSDADVSNKKLPEVGLQLGAFADDPVCPVICKLLSLRPAVVSSRSLETIYHRVACPSVWRTLCFATRAFTS
jgi:hypothetical protein